MRQNSPPTASFTHRYFREVYGVIFVWRCGDSIGELPERDRARSSQGYYETLNLQGRLQDIAKNNENPSHRG